MMKVLVVYDSQFGNTEKVAKTVTETFESEGTVLLKRASEATGKEVEDIDLLVIGSPTHAWNTTKQIRSFIGRLNVETAAHLRVATFDTSFRSRFSGSAAKKMSGLLKKKGCTVMEPSVSFIVKGNEGPLEDGELEKAASWARQIREKLKIR